MTTVARGMATERRDVWMVMGACVYRVTVRLMPLSLTETMMMVSGGWPTRVR